MNTASRRIVLLATDSSRSIIGEIVDGEPHAIAYSVYGERPAQQQVETQLGFNGQLREGKIGWYLLGNGYRAYNPRLMRFHSPDSWSPFGGGGLNAYMYCVGDPVNRSDPTGHVPWIEPAVKRFVMNAFNFLFGGAERTGSHKLTQAQANAVQKLGGMQAEKTGEMAALTTLGVYAVKKAPRPITGFNPASADTGRTTSYPIQPPPAQNAPAIRTKPKHSNRTVQFSQRVKQYDGPGPYIPRREFNQLQGGEVLPRKDYWPSSESFSSAGSSWTNASSMTQASSINSGRYSHASSLRDLDDLWSRLNELERNSPRSSRGSSHSAVSSIRN